MLKIDALSGLLYADGLGVKLSGNELTLTHLVQSWRTATGANRMALAADCVACYISGHYDGQVPPFSVQCHSNIRIQADNGVCFVIEDYTATMYSKEYPDGIGIGKSDPLRDELDFIVELYK